MKAYEIRKSGETNSLALVDRPDPTPGPGQVVVRIYAASLNYRDLVVFGNPGQPVGRIPLSDGAGEIVAVGANVSRETIGSRVAGTFFQNWPAGDTFAEIHDSALGGTLDGVLAEYVTLSAEGVVRIPDHLSYEEAATLPCAGVTAWRSLVELGGVKAGDTVLLLGTGGVSLFALQFAKLHGARVIITSSSDEKLERARALGADETVNYRTTPEWDRAVWALTGKRGVDHVVEVGGAGTLERSLRSVRYGGSVYLIGVLTGHSGQVNPMPVLQRSARLQGIYVGSRATFEDMNRAIAHAKLKPIIDRVFSFKDAPAAYEHMRSGSHFGKIVISVG